jgi:putative ABC transport system permease protein
VALVPSTVELPADVRLNLPVLGFTLLLSLATALGFGVIAALTLRLESAVGALVVSRRASIGAPARRAMAGLVIAEIAFAVVLVIGAGLILRTFAGLLAVDPGFTMERVTTVELALPADRYAAVEARRGFYDRAVAELEALPEVRTAGAAVVMPLTGNNWTVPFERTDRPVPAGERPPDVGWQLASGGFFRALDIPLLDGRLFDRRDAPETPPVVIVSEAVQRRFFPGERAVGRTIKLGDQTPEIVGVVGNIRRAGLNDEPRADMYFPFESALAPQITLFVRTEGEPAPALAAIQSAIRRIEPNAALANERTLADVASESVRITRLVLWLLGIFAAVAVTLAAVGIYGVMSYVVKQRAREIGTRMALGARPVDILMLVVRQGAVIAGIGTAIGLAIGLVAARSLRSILYQVSSADPLILGGAALLLAATALAACWLPARRAVRVDPARTLAEE